MYFAGPIVCFKNMQSENGKVEGAYQCWESSMGVKWKTIYISLLLLKISSGRRGDERTTKEHCKALPLYKFTSYLTNMRN